VPTVDLAAATDPASLAEALRPSLMRVSRRLRQEAQKAGVSALEALVLGQIRRQPGIGVCDLADNERISRPAMSSHVKRLEAEGWIKRVEDLEDGRRSGLAVTPAGGRRLDKIRRLRNDWLAARLAGLTPEARGLLAAAVEPLANLLDAEL
jgi:DNA-binding MarR family transcriptional regulator